ncbi:hypothetical protein RAJCM14343_4465 [Rhodococcus aetherivorans]|uniref:DUF2505 domain-containing protein n=1 Tax=Rhodococcus aetherivorans TaxID=191292 RepID=A0ABQ0YRH8_9NOCA|nr:DUF2505 domain-containing protein [Rhodococcus aetherivorans]ETT26351.1 Protein of unknown function DUF2505 [Rhodococcus rhodochrous ATCC 21198]KDE14131.1 hypothetical protein N505_0104710 [Rhodococcus aetherivorans]NGP24915.1 DUF2505 domain-containing protein [Rhodococcus aetherivorans]GES39197.1 hypothetical protein RAJCM14343_4465 [Rhodococcus aetherivorans]
MAKDFVFVTELEHSVHDVHAALVDERFWRGREEGRDTSSTAVEQPAGPGTVRVKVTDQADSSHLPAVVRGILRGPLVMERQDEWGPLVDEQAEGALVGGAAGLPIAIEGRSVLRASESGGAIIDLQGQVAVKIPLLGGQIEGLVHQMVTQIVENDRTALDSWLKG